MTRMPTGAAFILAGSGIYWMLSSQLIASFTVLTPGLFRSGSQGTLLVLIVGVVSATAGLWFVDTDLKKMQELFLRPDGWLFTLPLLLPVTDICLTIFGLRTHPEVVELNPVVASSILGGTGLLLPFIICYILMSEGLALLVLILGQNIFAGSRSLAALPFSLVCAAASVGPFSNAGLLIASVSGLLALAPAAAGAGSLAVLVYSHLRKPARLLLE